MTATWMGIEGGLPPTAVLIGVNSVAFIACLLLERLLPYRLEWQGDGLTFRVNMIHLPLTELSAHSVFRVVLIGAGFLLGLEFIQLQPEPGVWAQMGLDRLPVPLQLLVGMTILDLALYWQHRIFHERPALWHIHTLHHSPLALNTASAIRNHMITPLITAVLLMTFGLLALPEAIFVMVHVWIATKGFIQHSNADLHTPLFDPFFQTPRVHRWHHSERSEEADRNFGIMLTIWDRIPWHRLPLLGPRLRFQYTTFFLPADRLHPERVGVGRPFVDPERSALANWWQHFLYPFRAWRDHASRGG